MFYLSIPLTYFVFGSAVGPVRDVLLSMLFLHGLVPSAIMHGPAGGWSVADEALFYISLPVLFVCVRTLKSALLLISVTLPVLYMTSIAMRHFYPKLNEYFTFLSFSVELPVFLMGIVAYFLWKEYIAFIPQDRVKLRKELSVLLLLLAALLYCSLLPFDNSTLYGTSAIGLLLLLALSLHAWSLFVNRATIFLGKISYSVYLLHFFVMRGIESIILRTAGHHAILNRPVVQFGIVLIATLLSVIPIAAVSWRFIEEPGIRLGRRLIAHLEKRSVRKHDTELLVPAKSLSGQGSSPDAQF